MLVYAVYFSRSVEIKIILSRIQQFIMLCHFFCGRLPPFGHGYTQKDSRLENFTLVFVLSAMIACFIDWSLLEKKYGYRTPKIIQLMFRVSFLFTQL
jgi:hypothetical protein